MTGSRAYFQSEVERVQRGGDPGSAPAGDEEQGYVAGAPGAEDQFDEQEQAGQSVELPDEWPAAFWNALTPEAQREFQAGDHDLIAEWRQWSAAQDYEAGAALPPEAPAELPPTADEAASFAQAWADLGRDGGTSEESAAECFEQAQAWQDIARSAAIAEERAGRRQAWTLGPADERAAVQRAIDERVRAGVERWGPR